MLEKKDIQGLVARGYVKLPQALFILLKVTDTVAAKKYLRDIADEVNTIQNSPEHYAIQVAFTGVGLRALGLPGSALATFSREFLEGMSESFRALILGDQNEDHPDKWKWGGSKNDQVHIMLLIYAKNVEILDEWLNNKKNDFAANGMVIIRKQDTNDKIPDSKEHFGFRDGISNPVMSGFKAPAPGEKNIKAGEFVLGYTNEYDQVSDRPIVNSEDDPNNILPPCEDDGKQGCKDLGRNGSYLVYRQMHQNVYKFWKYLSDNSKEPAGTNIEAAIKLGAKMVGRWPGGAPLALSPDKDDPKLAEATDFSYAKEDPDGMKCPFGAHVRRSNPRDQLLGRGNDAAAEMIRKHALLRRGRSYGSTCVPTMDPQHVLDEGKDDCDRGLHFIGLVGNLSRQFEFVQNAWIRNPAFDGLFHDADPIIAARQAPGEPLNDQFTCPALPLRRKYTNLPQFTNIVGGEYFFLPGIRALKYIASC